MNLIGINGYKRSGKGTVATILSENHPGVVYDLGFADKVKIGALKALGFDRPPRDLIALADEWKVEAGAQISVSYREPGTTTSTLHDLTGRQLLQWFGTEVGRDLFGKDFWVDQVLPRPVFLNEVPSDLRPRAEELGNQQNLEARYPEIDVVAITDLRFENEAERVLALGGVVWRVNRPGYEGEGHASEQRLPDNLVTHEIDNSGDLDDLSDEVYVAMQETLGWKPVTSVA